MLLRNHLTRAIVRMWLQYQAKDAKPRKADNPAMAHKAGTHPGQSDLFGEPCGFPEGFRYRASFLTEGEERALVEAFASLEFKEFEFHGFLGRRRVVSFGWRYDFNEGGLNKALELPPFLLPMRERASAFAGFDAREFEQALITEYTPEAAIGWHRDRSVFGEVIGMSLLAPCTFRLRRKEGSSWRRASMVMAPRSVYLLSGEARTEWEHSIPPVTSLRYSITLRRLKTSTKPGKPPRGPIV
jgi:alkylated DNA repair dioxygenase AlkB